MGSGKIWAGIWVDEGEGAMRMGGGVAAGEDKRVGGRGAGELCLVGEKEGRWLEEGGKEEWGLLKL